MFCFHKWVIESTHYTPPLDHWSAGSISPAEVRAFNEGTTNIYYRCRKCGTIKETQVFGKYDAQR